MKRVRGSPGAGTGGMVQVVTFGGKVSVLVALPHPLSPPMIIPAIGKLYTNKILNEILGRV